MLVGLLVPWVVYWSRNSLAAMRRGRRGLSLGLRLALVLLLVLALAGVGAQARTDGLSVVFLVDRSDSIGVGERAALDEAVREAISEIGEGEEAGVVVFGADALVDRPMLPSAQPPDLNSAPQTSYSDLGEAVRLGLAMLSSDTARRLVLLSDGRENLGDVEAAARLSAAYGVPVDVVSLATGGGPEVWVEGLHAPATVRRGERVSLEVSVTSSTDTTATLILLQDNAPLTTQEVRLSRGANHFAQSLAPAVPGFHTYSVEVVPAPGSDTRGENNRYGAYSSVLGPTRLLMVEGVAGEGEALRRALGPSSDVTTVVPSQMPALSSLAGYDGVVLVNVPASAFAPSALADLQVVVRDLGRGLVVVGGDRSYAAGGYFRTPLEAMLPLDLNLPSKLEIPSVGMALVIDRSGSMDAPHAGSSGVKKIDLAKEAAYRAVAQLSERDYVGVITFDSAADWVIELQALGDPARFKERIGSIGSGGGTNIYAGLAPAVDALAASKAKSRHIVLLTDGVSEGGDYTGLLAKMKASNITLSTVAVGQDADTVLLQTLAAGGGGRYYYTEDGNALPEIFAGESHFATRSYIIERPLSPRRTSPSPILDGLGELPVLQGYVGTSPRPGGEVALVSDAGDPLLAQWQYGLGRVVAWTSDAKGQWARDWIAWDGFARFWAQTARWSTGSESAGALQPSVEVEGGEGVVTVEAVAPDGSALNSLSVDAVVVGPGAVTATVSLRQTGAGRYEGSFPTKEEGAYLVRVLAEGEGVGKASRTLGVVVPYSPEYRGGESDSGLLGRIASLTGGRELTLDELGAAFDHNLPPATRQIALWPWLLLLATLLLPLDVGVRRLGIAREDLERAWGEVGERLRRRGPQPASAGTGTSSQMSDLIGAKARIRDRLERPVGSGEMAVGSEAQSQPLASQQLPTSARDLQQQESAASATAVPPTQPIAPGGPIHEEESLAARLRRSRERK